MAGANSIFTGDKLLTTPNPALSEDEQMFSSLGIRGKLPFTGEDAALPQLQTGLMPDLPGASPPRAEARA